MSDDIRDKFPNDDEFNEFKRSFDDYKNKKGMFDPAYAAMRIQELVYKNLILQKKKYFLVPDDITGIKNMALYMFHIEKIPNFEEIISIFLN